MVATDLKNNKNIAILGSGSLGIAIARGIASGKSGYKSSQIWLTRRNLDKIQNLKDEEGFQITSDNLEAVSKCSILIIGVLPPQVSPLLDSIKHLITKDHIIISVVLGITIDCIRSHLPKDIYSAVPIIRAMPNTAIQYCESMTCIANRSENYVCDAEQELIDERALKITENIFNCCGETIVISEELMVQAPAICSCATAFFLRMIRAASLGGTQIGFHSHDALKIVTQTAKGAAVLLMKNHSNPEAEIDKITSPGGATIAGLNEMDKHGLSSAIIEGIAKSAEKSSKSQAALSLKLMNGASN